MEEANKAILKAEQQFLGKEKGNWKVTLEGAYGKYYENVYAQKHYKDVETMSVNYAPDGKVLSEMDIITKNEVIQLKTGSGLPSDSQIEATVLFGKANNKTPVWIYNPNLVTKGKVEKALQKWKDKGWTNVVARADKDMSAQRHIVMMNYSDVFKF